MGLRRFAGAGFASDRSAWGYGGIRYPTEWSGHIVVTHRVSPPAAIAKGKAKALPTLPLWAASVSALDIASPTTCVWAPRITIFRTGN